MLDHIVGLFVDGMFKRLNINLIFKAVLINRM